MKIFSGTSNPDLAKKIAVSLNTTLGSLTIERFKDGEILPRFNESIRGEDVYLVQSTNSSDFIMETSLIIDAARRAGANTINLINPYYGYSRQDKVDHVRSSIGSKVVATMFESLGLDRIVCIDLHNSAIQAFFDKAEVIHLNGSKVFVNYIKGKNLDNLTILSPDQGGMARATQFAKMFENCQIAVINKKRIKPNEIHSMDLIGSVEGRNVIIVDDLCDTAGTLKKAAELIKKNGALSVYAIATHGVLSGNAIENIETSDLEELIVSDSIDLKDKKSEKIVIISCANQLANCINRLESKKSIDELNKV